ncbi:NACHT, LRR and PYD domains-containing protein 3 isoform X2 [Salminus brasiliensis]
MISCNDIFKKVIKRGLKERVLRSVLTKGIAGIGKTVSVQKFVLDWAEGKANQDVEFMFVLPFRELNLVKDDRYSLHGLLSLFHPELKRVDSGIYESCKVVFVFDGLDESRMTLFPVAERIADPAEASPVPALIANLITGQLLPSSRIWITSRPAAANQIPSYCISRLTEVQGFTDPQKEEYFRRRISDPDQASKIILHVKAEKSLHAMCYIPVFCWMCSSVLQEIAKQDHQPEFPKTLTELYVHFLLTQTATRSQKSGGEIEADPERLLDLYKEPILKLAELAFTQLMKGNVMFYQEDLSDCGVSSGFCTEIFREESVLHKMKVYCFVHLSLQEFLAALYVFHCFFSKNLEAVKFLQNLKERPEELSLEALLKAAIVEASGSWIHPNGHLDLFLRFLLGIALETNQRLLQGLLPHLEQSAESIRRTAQFIKRKIQTEHLPAEKAINLFMCLLEMKVQAFDGEIEEFLQTGELSAAQCSVIAHLLQMSDKVLVELDPKKYGVSVHGYVRLVPAVRNCRKALFAHCNLSQDCWETLSWALSSESPLRELDLCNNDLQDSGLELLSAGLKSPHCKLETLRVALCDLTETSGGTLASVLQFSGSALRELDLSNNDLDNAGVKQLSAGIRSSHCKLEVLRLSGCMITEDGCSSLALALKSNPSHLRELDLSYNHPGEFAEKLLTARLEDPFCRLERLSLEHGGDCRIKPGLNKYPCELTLDLNTAHMELARSQRSRRTACVGPEPSDPDHPDRFSMWQQVLCLEPLTTRCYWEAPRDWGWGAIAATYKGISRKGGGCDSKFGGNENSWCLRCYENCYSVTHNNQGHVIPSSGFERIGVYLDWAVGTLSFYSIDHDSRAEAQTHLHTFRGTFSQPLYAGFGVEDTSDTAASPLDGALC